MNSKSTKNFRVFIQVLTNSRVSSQSISYRSSFSSCCKYVSLCQRNLYPHQCHVIYSIQKLDEISGTYITISRTDFELSDLPF